MTRVFLFWVIGIAATAVFGGLASIKPSTFGLFTLPFWILPALLGLGVHDNIFPLGLLGASLFHRVVSFAVDRLAVGGMRGSPEIASHQGFAIPSIIVGLWLRGRAAPSGPRNVLL